MLTEREEMIVAWLRQEGERWWAQVASYRAAGNDGPYLGQPSYGDIANRIERGEHLKRPEPTIPASEWAKVPSVGYGETW